MKNDDTDKLGKDFLEALVAMFPDEIENPGGAVPANPIKRLAIMTLMEKLVAIKPTLMDNGDDRLLDLALRVVRL